MPEGFFDFDDVPTVRGDETPRMGKTPPPMFVGNCETCGLSNGCESPKMSFSGKGKKQILIVTDAPGRSDDESGSYFMGQSGEVLRDLLNDMDLSLDRDFWITGAINCFPNADELPPGAILACRRRLMDLIEKLSPRAIILLGKPAVTGLIGHRLTGRLAGTSIVDFVGCSIPDQVLNIWLFPSWAPSQVLKSKNDPVMGRQIQDAFSRAISSAEKNQKPADAVPSLQADINNCTILYDKKAVIDLLRWIRTTEDHWAFDYETTGKKPYRKGHKIVTASVSNGEKAWAFPFFDDEDFRVAWCRFLMSPRIRKTAHNAKFEDDWTLVLLGFSPNNVDWDTMLAAHILNNRQVCNLKFQTYVSFGVAGYDDEVDLYLETTKAEAEVYGANGFNSMLNAPLDKVLLYNALDSLYTARLRTKQEGNPVFHSAVAFFTEAGHWMSSAETAGIAMAPEEKISGIITGLTTKMAGIEAAVRKHPDMRLWNKSADFRMSAAADLSHLLFNRMKLTPTEFTDTKRIKSDKEALSGIDHPIVKGVLDWRRYEKARGTYLQSYIREQRGDGLLHPFFDIHTVDTYRGSSRDPNFQNIPKHDKEIALLIRQLLIPRPGRKLAEWDYKALEVCINACYNKDPALINYINDLDSDMHRDMGAKLFIRPRKEVTKGERQGAKNGFVFPTFYGSYYANTGGQLWEDAAPETLEHLRNEGIDDKDDFIAHVRSVEKWFWEERFPVAYEWTKKTLKDYDRKGYIELYTGFRCYGPMSRNQIVNYRIQGSGFHCLLWTFGQVLKEIEKRELRSLLIGQIHDAAVGDVCPEEEAEIDELFWEYGTQKIREHWPWIIVPLRLEKSVSGVDGDWAHMKDGGMLHDGK